MSAPFGVVGGQNAYTVDAWKRRGGKFCTKSMNQNRIIQIIIKLMEFFLNHGLIPLQRDQMS